MMRQSRFSACPGVRDGCSADTPAPRSVAGAIALRMLWCAMPPRPYRAKPEDCERVAFGFCSERWGGTCESRDSRRKPAVPGHPISPAEYARLKMRGAESRHSRASARARKAVQPPTRMELPVRRSARAVQLRVCGLRRGGGETGASLAPAETPRTWFGISSTPERPLAKP